MYAQAMQLGGYGHLNGSSRFQVTTCIGNWLEERELRRSILKDLLAKKTSGSLKLDAYHQRMSTALAEVELTRVADDAYVHCGDLVQLVHLATGHTVAGDVNEQDPRPGEEACAATAAADVRSPCARNTFVITKYRPNKAAPLEPYYEDDVLRYGQKIRLALNPMAAGLPLDAQGGPRPLFLFSKPLSMTHYAKYSRKQLVALTARDTYDTVWQVLTPDPSQRVISEGVEVMAGAPILLVHAATSKPLMVEESRYPNEFGSEFELSARQSTSQGMKLALEQSAKGLLKGSIPKGEDSLNYFAFITGTKVEKLPAASSSSGDGDAYVAIQSLVADVSSKAGGYELLEKKLVMWSNQSNELPTDELLLIIRQVGSRLPESDVQALAVRFATHRASIIDAGSLLQAIRQVAGR